MSPLPGHDLAAPAGELLRVVAARTQALTVVGRGLAAVRTGPDVVGVADRGIAPRSAADLVARAAIAHHAFAVPTRQVSIRNTGTNTLFVSFDHSNWFDIAAGTSFDDRFVCISDDSAKWAIRQGISRRKVRVQLNGIDLTRFAYSGSEPDGPAVLVARLSPEKSIDTLLRAVPIIIAKCPDFRLEIAGDGPCGEALRRLASESNLGDAVRFLGTVRDVPSLLSRARLFILSSLTEGISLTLLEASARGLPIVATNVGGNPEVVADGVTGLLVPHSDPNAMASEVIRLWHEPKLRERMGFAGRLRVEERFDIRRMMAAYEAMYTPLGQG